MGPDRLLGLHPSSVGLAEGSRDGDKPKTIPHKRTSISLIAQLSLVGGVFLIIQISPSTVKGVVSS